MELGFWEANISSQHQNLMGGYFDICGCSVNMIHSGDSTVQLNEPEKANKKSEKLSVNTSPSQGHLFLPSHDL